MATEWWRGVVQGKGKLGSFTRMCGVVVRREGGGGERERHALENNLHLFRGISHFFSLQW
jgi:hypothetical protein